MANWSLIRSTIGTWIANRTGLPVHWNKRPRGWFAEDAGYVILRIIGRRSVGLDQVTYTYDATAAAGSEIQYSQNGTRQFTLQVQVRTMLQSDDEDALHYTSLIRDSISLPQLSTSVLAAAEIDFANILGEVEIEETLDGRELSIVTLDILFNAYSSTDDTATGYIEEINDMEFYDVDNPTPPLWTGDIDVT